MRMECLRGNRKDSIGRQELHRKKKIQNESEKEGRGQIAQELSGFYVKC
jgi:hypothetical protein